MNWQNETLFRPLLAASRPGLLSDMDGTLSPIVPQPEAAQITPENRRLLGELAARMPLVAVVSGRGAADVWARVGIEQVVCIGNHGMERWDGATAALLPEAAAFRPSLAAAIQALKPELLPGMTLDDKGASLAVHYRRAGDINLEAVRARVAAVAALHHLAMFEGRKVFELRPPIAVNKGSVLERLVEAYRLDAAVFIGDDTTDADALRAARDLRHSGRCYAVGLGVEADETPAAVRENADWMLQGVPGVESFLSWLLRSLSASST